MTDTAPATPGWYPDAYNEGQEQYWDGERWTDARREAENTGVTADYRRAALAAQVQPMIARGFRVESQSDYQAVLVSGKPVNHVLHLILTIVTAGIWLIPWIIIAIAGGERRQMVTVDDAGNVATRKV